MRYILIILAIVLASVLGYYAGKYFYKEKINTTNDTNSKPLIAPLIEEKTFTTNSDSQKPFVLVPQVDKEKQSKTEKVNQTTINQTKNTITEKNTTQNNTTESKEDQYDTQSNSTEVNSEEINKEKKVEDKDSKNENQTTVEENVHESYYIQVGSFTSLENAESIKEQLVSIGLQPKIEKIITGGNSIYRVVLGPYKTQEEVQLESDKLKRMGYDNVIRSY